MLHLELGLPRWALGVHMSNLDCIQTRIDTSTGVHQW